MPESQSKHGFLSGAGVYLSGPIGFVAFLADEEQTGASREKYIAKTVGKSYHFKRLDAS